MVLQTIADLDAFAELDGFPSWEAFAEFCQDRHGPIIVFSGVIVAWDELSPGKGSP